MKEEKGTFKIKPHSQFNLSNPQNVQNLVAVIAQCGYYVRVKPDGTGYMVLVFTDRF